MNNLESLKEYAKVNKVPIIQDEGLNYLLSVIKEYQVKKVLEIGSAIGYSAINMVLAGADVVTFERDINMYNEAIKNINDFNFNDNIKIYNVDALNAYELVKDEEFDLIFIDAAKAQYEKFFNLYTPLLKKGGIVICDNLAFHGLVEEEDLSQYSRHLRQLIRKIRNFVDFLTNNPDYNTEFVNIGDGLSKSVKK